MNVLDLFSGIGGFSIGLERAGMRTVAFCETEPFCRAVLAKHWPSVPCYDDVRTLTADRLARDGISVDVICGGFPCQDISHAGKGAGLAGERSGLWYEFHRLIEEVKPRYAIIENVSALRNRGLDAVLGSLASIGYDAEWHCIPASAVGAPHRRDRIWITAYRNAYDQGKSIGAVNVAKQPRLSSNLAYPSLVGRGKERSLTGRRGEGDSAEGSVGSGPLLGGAVADAYQQRLEGHDDRPRATFAPEIITADAWSAGISRGSRWWASEPDVGRVAHGVPSRTHRLKALGNAVVPQIPEMIGRAIMEHSNDH